MISPATTARRRLVVQPSMDALTAARNLILSDDPTLLLQFTDWQQSQQAFAALPEALWKQHSATFGRGDGHKACFHSIGDAVAFHNLLHGYQRRLVVPRAFTTDLAGYKPPGVTTLAEETELLGWVEQFFPSAAGRGAATSDAVTAAPATSTEGGMDVADVIPVASLLGLPETLRRYRAAVRYANRLNQSAIEPLRPFHDVCFPSKREFYALLLVHNWITEQKATRNLSSAVHVGCQSGVGSALLLRAGIMSVLAADSNTNALLCTDEFLTTMLDSKRVSSVGRTIRTAPAQCFPQHLRRFDTDFSLLASPVPPLFSQAVRDDFFDRKYCYSQRTAATRYLDEALVALRRGGVCCIVASNHDTLINELDAASMAEQRSGGKESSKKVDLLAVENRLRAASGFSGLLNKDDLVDPVADDTIAGLATPDTKAAKWTVVHQRTVSVYGAGNSEQTLSSVGARLHPNEKLQREAVHRLATESVFPLMPNARRELELYVNNLRLDVAMLENVWERAGVGADRQGSTKDITDGYNDQELAHEDYITSFEYNNYLPKTGPRNYRHWSEEAFEYTFLDKDGASGNDPSALFNEPRRAGALLHATHDRSAVGRRKLRRSALKESWQREEFSERQAQKMFQGEGEAIAAAAADVDRQARWSWRNRKVMRPQQPPDDDDGRGSSKRVGGQGFRQGKGP